MYLYILSEIMVAGQMILKGRILKVNEAQAKEFIDRGVAREATKDEVDKARGKGKQTAPQSPE